MTTQPLLTTKEIAKRLGLSVRQVKYLIQRKAFPVVRIVRSVRVSVEDLEAYVNACKVPSASSNS